MPHWLEQLIYPINKADLDILRFAHFVALAVIAVRFVPAGSPVLTSRWLWPMILCGQNSLEIFCLGRSPGVHGLFRADRACRRPRPARPGRHFRRSDHVRRGVAVVMVQAQPRQERPRDPARRRPTPLAARASRMKPGRETAAESLAERALRQRPETMIAASPVPDILCKGGDVRVRGLTGSPFCGTVETSVTAISAFDQFAVRPR